MRLSIGTVVLSIFVWSLGCASPRLKEYQAQMEEMNPPVRLIETPFVPSTTGTHPDESATLSMLIAKYNLHTDLSTIRRRVEKEKDLLQAARRLGLAAYVVPDFKSLLGQIREGHPVLLYQDPGLIWMNYGHHALVVGYEKFTHSLIVHSGDIPYRKIDLALFYYSWNRGGQWAYVLVPPKVIPKGVEPNEVLSNGKTFESFGMNDHAAEIYEAGRQRWPKRYEFDAGLANVHVAKSDSKSAVRFLESALSKNPTDLDLKKKLSHLRQDGEVDPSSH